MVIDSETALLAAILVNQDVLARVQDIVRPEHFSVVNRIIYRAIMWLAEQGKVPDVVLVRERLIATGEWEKVGRSYLQDLVDSCPLSTRAEDYAQQVARRGGMLEVREAMTRAADKITEAQVPEQVLGSIESIVADLYAKLPGKKPTSFRERLSEAFAQVQDRAVAGTPTGFHDLDDVLGGMRPGEVLVVAGRPSMGKTSFANALAIQVAKLGKPTLYFSMESPARQVALNIACSRARVSVSTLLKGAATEEDLRRLLDAASDIGTAPLWINDDPRLTPERMIGKARALDAEQKIGLVILDYIQLCTLGGHENRQQEIAAISRSLKILAMGLNVPVLALSQLNRRVDADSDKRPKLSDLRESGAIEQDADVVMLLYRDEYYNPDSADKGICEVNVAKHRNGPVGTARLTFQPQFMRFESLSYAKM